tara:strand:+ start:148 stop:366 length:219 start_codon:yes stop_codon:yes gene_type:complete
MSKQTAIQQAIDRIQELQDALTSSSQKLGLAQAMDILEDFKEMEKQQIIDSFKEDTFYYMDAEQYYNETFNK